MNDWNGIGRAVAARRSEADVSTILVVDGDEPGRFLASTGAASALAVNRDVVDLRALCARAFRELEHRAGARRLKLETALFAHAVHADEELLWRVVMTLLEHEIGRSPPGTTITVVSTPRRMETELRVMNWGAEVPVVLREPEDGTGAAGWRDQLAFCRRAVAAHGGALSVEDGSPGTLFCLRLPAPLAVAMPPLPL